MLLNWVSKNVDISAVRECCVEALHTSEVGYLVSSEIDVLQGLMRWELILKFLELVPTQVHALQFRQCLIPKEALDLIRLDIQFLELRHVFEELERLEFVINSFEDADARMASPAVIHLLQFIIADVEYLQFR